MLVGVGVSCQLQGRVSVEFNYVKIAGMNHMGELWFCELGAVQRQPKAYCVAVAVMDVTTARFGGRRVLAGFREISVVDRL